MDNLKLVMAAVLVVAGVVVYYLMSDSLTVFRILVFLAFVAAAIGVAALSSHGTEALSFIKSANVERRKVVWPTPTETTQATLMVIVMVIILGLYLWFLDLVSFWAVYDLILDVPSI